MGSPKAPENNESLFECAEREVEEKVGLINLPLRKRVKPTTYKLNELII